MTKAAILIDGGFFLKRLPRLAPGQDTSDPGVVDRLIGVLVRSHLDQLQKQYGGEKRSALLYRCFWYDARPYSRKGNFPVSGRAIDYEKSAQAKFRNDLFGLLRKRASFAVRLGEVRRERAWILSEQAQKALLQGRRAVADLTDDDFAPGLRQKAVDMRFGLDIASLTLKRQVDTLILVTGDSDFVPASKLARREGVRVILDPLWQSVDDQLFEHIDGLKSGLKRPRRAPVQRA